METETRQEILLGPWVGEIEGFLGRHGHEDLHERENAVGKDAPVGIALDLVDGLTDVDAAALELNMEHGDAVDEQHHVAAPI